MDSNHWSLRAHHVSFAYGSRQAVRDVTLTVQPGDLVALAGPNGSGKSTLVRLLAGTRQPAAGTVTLDTRPLGELRPRERARRIAVVPQQVDPRVTFTVEALVGMGRSPYVGLLGAPSAGDRAAVDAALGATDTTELRDRHFDELSGGEQQRVAVAMALAQETTYLLLDEPTVHMDLQHQHELLSLLRRLHGQREIAVLAVMHDLNLAALYFDRLAVMSAGTLVADGAPSEVLTRPDITAVFRAPLQLVTHPRTRVPQVLLDRED